MPFWLWTFFSRVCRYADMLRSRRSFCSGRNCPNNKTDVHMETKWPHSRSQQKHDRHQRIEARSQERRRRFASCWPMWLKPVLKQLLIVISNNMTVIPGGLFFEIACHWRPSKKCIPSRGCGIQIQENDDYWMCQCGPDSEVRVTLGRDLCHSVRKWSYRYSRHACRVKIAVRVPNAKIWKEKLEKSYVFVPRSPHWDCREYSFPLGFIFLKKCSFCNVTLSKNNKGPRNALNLLSLLMLWKSIILSLSSQETIPEVFNQTILQNVLNA